MARVVLFLRKKTEIKGWVFIILIIIIDTKLIHQKGEIFITLIYSTCVLVLERELKREKQDK